MNQSKIHLLIHPVRMRILQCFITGKHLTVHDLMKHIPEIPQASVYRHLKVLRDIDLLTVVKETPIRGATEKVYALNEISRILGIEELKKLSKEEHFQLFFRFMTNLLMDYEKYLQKDDMDMLKDGLSYTQASFYLSDSEFIELLSKIKSLVMEAAQNEPTKKRKLRSLATISIPQIQ